MHWWLHSYIRLYSFHITREWEKNVYFMMLYSYTLNIENDPLHDRREIYMKNIIYLHDLYRNIEKVVWGLYILYTYAHISISTYLRSHVLTCTKEYLKLAILNIRNRCSHKNEHLIISLSKEKYVVILCLCSLFLNIWRNTNKRKKLFLLSKLFTLQLTIK